MTIIGIYDSGIGGLTTLIKLQSLYKDVRFFYLADNLNHPFGNKSDKEIKQIVTRGIDRLKCHSDLQILACNTASTLYDGDVIKLLPPIENIKQPSECLLLCTHHTAKTYERYNFSHAQTNDLASLIEVQLRLAVRNNSLDMTPLLPYVAKHIFPYRGVKKVILGCSHYPYCKAQIDKVLRGVEFVDGNENLVKNLDEYILKNDLNITKFDRLELGVDKNQTDDKLNNKTLNLQDKIESVEFAFTGMNESKFYKKLLYLLYTSDLTKIMC